MTVARTELNRRLKGERHAKRMQKQADKRRGFAIDLESPNIDMVPCVIDLPVPRGSARAARRKHLSVLYTKRQAAAQAAALAG